MKTLINKMTYSPGENAKEKGPWISQAVPDETLSIKQIYERYGKGQPLGGGHLTDMYRDTEKPTLDDPDMMELARMDLADRHEYQQKLRQDIAQRKADLKAAQEALIRKSTSKTAVKADMQDFEKEVDESATEKKEAKKPVKKAPEKPTTDS